MRLSCPRAPRMYAKKVKNAQEAHEAIRPAGERFRVARSGSRSEVGASPKRDVYDLIWKRTVASQMTDAVGETVTGATSARHATDRHATRCSRRAGTVITHARISAVSMSRDTDDEDPTRDSERQPATGRAEGDGRGRSQSWAPHGHQTQPPVAIHRGVARQAARRAGCRVDPPPTPPSSATIQDRGYVWKKGSALVPTFTAFSRREPARTALPRPRRLRVHRSHGRRPRQHRDRRPKRPGSVAASAFYFGCRRCTTVPGLKRDGLRAPRRHRRPGGQHDPARRRTPTGGEDRRPGRSLRTRTWSAG